jgi:hypothetical protein
MTISLRRSRRAPKKGVSDFNVGDIVEVSDFLFRFVRFIASVFRFWNNSTSSTSSIPTFRSGQSVELFDSNCVLNRDRKLIG